MIQNDLPIYKINFTQSPLLYKIVFFFFVQKIWHQQLTDNQPSKWSSPGSSQEWHGIMAFVWF